MTFSRLTGWLLLIPGLALVGLVILVPLLSVLRFSLGDEPTGTQASGFSFVSYAQIWTSSYYLSVIGRTFGIALFATLVSFVLALPVAYAMTRSGERLRSVIMLLTLLPLLAGSVVLSVGWVTLLRGSGVASQALQAMGITDEPLRWTENPFLLGVIMALIVLPFIVLSLQGSLDAVDVNQERASLALGWSKASTFFRVVFPQTVPGIVAGTSLSFVLCVNAFSAPNLIGGGSIRLAAPTVYGIINTDGNWSLGGALAVSVIAVSLISSGLYTLIIPRVFDRWRLAVR
ncbi:ABC transporter permease [Brevibacterium album]|uniref:ABC transporter permease n=1 Tax=Brevibacterium album TaxID=417948 RepID=UPI00040CEBA3|nr:ABC transporter permease [Brevibacterium album]